MKAVLGTCLALALAGAAPALAAPQGYGAQAGDTQSYQGGDRNGGDYGRGGRHHGAHHARHFSVGDRVPHRMLGSRHVVTHYRPRLGVSPPEGGAKWLRFRSQFVLVDADGTVRNVIPRQPHARHRGERGSDRAYRNQEQGYPDQGQGGDQGYPDRNQGDDQGYPDDQSQ